MATVTVTGNAWDHTGSPISAALHPELWFRPSQSNVAGNDLVAGVEAKATLNLTTGAFSVVLVSAPGIKYTPFMRWLINPEENDPAKWAFGYAEWRFQIAPYPVGGPIGTLTDVDLTAFNVLVTLDTPPAGYRGWWLYSPAQGQEMPLDDPLIGELRMVS